MIHGGQLQGLGVLNKRAKDFLDEFLKANTQVSINSNMAISTSWCPSPLSRFKLKFDVAIFTNQAASGVGAII